MRMGMGKGKHIFSENWLLFPDSQICPGHLLPPILVIQKKKKSKILKDSCADSVVWAAFPFHSSSGRAGMLLLTLPTIPTGNWAGSWDTFGVPLLIPRLDSTAIQNLATLTLLEDLRLPALEASQHLESLWNSYCRTLSGHTSALDAPVSE